MLYKCSKWHEILHSVEGFVFTKLLEYLNVTYDTTWLASRELQKGEISKFISLRHSHMHMYVALREQGK